MKPLFCSAIIVLLSAISASAQAQYSVLYSFGSVANDGNFPNGGLLFDSAGNIYGTTQRGGAGSSCNFGCGSIFELSPSADGTWSETVLYSFCSLADCADGRAPAAGLISDASGNLYGTTTLGGTSTKCGGGCGTVFELSPPTVPGGSWTEAVLLSFLTGLNDGANPNGRLTWDAEGNLYGTTLEGGLGVGSVFELSPVQGAGWAAYNLYAFCADGPPKCPDGFAPMAGVSFDKSGNLYGTNSQGGAEGDWGVVYQLSPPLAGGAWTETTLYAFEGKSGGDPFSEVNFDATGKMYVTAFQGKGEGECGSVVRLTPEAAGAEEAAHYLFLPAGIACNPAAGVFLDSSDGTLYGTSETAGALGAGNIYQIKGERGRVLYTFCSQSGCADGLTPEGSLVEHDRKLYSTTTKGGAYGQGVVFQLAP